MDIDAKRIRESYFRWINANTAAKLANDTDYDKKQANADKRKCKLRVRIEVMTGLTIAQIGELA